MTTLVPFIQNPETSDDTQQRISQILKRFLEQHQGDDACLRDLFNTMGDRAFAPVLIICALPQAVPLPIAGISAFVAVPLMLVSGQMILGFQQPWLPDPLLDYSFKREHCEIVLSGAITLLEKLETFVEPRWPMFTNPEAERVVGGVLLLLSVIIALPIPFGNLLPALAIVLICLGLIEKDGLIIAISAMIGGLTPPLLLLFV